MTAWTLYEGDAPIRSGLDEAEAEHLQAVNHAEGNTEVSISDGSDELVEA